MCSVVGLNIISKTQPKVIKIKLKLWKSRSIREQNTFIYAISPFSVSVAEIHYFDHFFFTKRISLVQNSYLKLSIKPLGTKKAYQLQMIIQYNRQPYTTIYIALNFHIPNIYFQKLCSCLSNLSSTSWFQFEEETKITFISQQFTQKVIQFHVTILNKLDLGEQTPDCAIL